MQFNGKHGIVAVDVRNSPFWQTSGHGAAGGAGGLQESRGTEPRGHAVLIKDVEIVYERRPDGSVYVDGAGQPIIDVKNSKVSVLNSWGRAADHVRSNLRGYSIDIAATLRLHERMETG
jgi:hypothetical protein